MRSQRNLGEFLATLLDDADRDWVHNSGDPRARRLHSILCALGWRYCC